MFGDSEKKDLSNIIIWEKIKGSRSIIFAAAILMIAAIMVMPVPAIIMDLLLCLSIAVTVLILMTVLFIERPLDFSSFPNVLLVVTIFRLALNVSTTRLILSNGDAGIAAAGDVVKAFGYFVAKGSPIIGAIMFGILTIINFVVITKGSGRIAEVAARFSLDSMPGKQMAIDADLSSGLIGEDVAKKRRKELEDESNFYGSMDGANKFVRGDAIAGLLITFINFIGGILVGVLQKEMSFSEALNAYAVLTIGDGLVSQIPSLFVSVSAGLMVTKSGVIGSVDKAIFEQLGKYPRSLAISSCLIGLMGIIVPGMPFLPFAIISAICGIGAYFMMRGGGAADHGHANEVNGERGAMTAAESENDQIMNSLKIDEVRIEFGYELISLIQGSSPACIPQQVKVLRKNLAKEMGFVLPSVRMVDNIQIEPNRYVIYIKDIKRGEGDVYPNKIMVMSKNDSAIELPGIDAKEPVFGIAARWISYASKEEAIFHDYTVIEPETVIATHLTEIVRDSMAELMTYNEVMHMINSASSEHKKLVEELIPAEITVVKLKRVLQALLNEGVSIKDFTGILEAIAESSGKVSSVESLVEKVRTRMAGYLCKLYSDDNGILNVIALSSNWEQMFLDNIAGEGESQYLVMAPSKLQEFVIGVSKEYDKNAATNPVILTSPQIRRFVRSVIERFRSNIPVVSHSEIHFKAKIKTIGQI